MVNPMYLYIYIYTETPQLLVVSTARRPRHTGEQIQMRSPYILLSIHLSAYPSIHTGNRYIYACMYMSCFVTEDEVSLNFAVTRPRHAVQQICIYTHHLSICLFIQLPKQRSIQVTDLSRYVCICLALLSRTELL